MKPTRILLADDHEVVRRGLRSLLENNPGYEISGEAVDGRDAIEKATRIKPDVVIMDIAMPGVDGLEATRRIVKETQQTKVLIMTVDDSEPVITEAFRAGACGYLLKSSAGRELLTALHSLENGKPYFASNIADLILKNPPENHKEDADSAGKKFLSKIP